MHLVSLDDRRGATRAVADRSVPARPMDSARPNPVPLPADLRLKRKQAQPATVQHRCVEHGRTARTDRTTARGATLRRAHLGSLRWCTTVWLSTWYGGVEISCFTIKTIPRNSQPLIWVQREANAKGPCKMVATLFSYDFLKFENFLVSAAGMAQTSENHNGETGDLDTHPTTCTSKP